MEKIKTMGIDQARELIFAIAFNNWETLTTEELTALQMGFDALKTIKDWQTKGH